MPPEYVAIQSLLLRAYQGRESPPAIRVVGGPHSREVEGRYRVLFPGLTFDRSGVEGFVRRLGGPARRKARRTRPRTVGRA